jgi:signal transduction histidine kinase
MILIVDDKQENIFSLKTLLQLNNYKVDSASSGEEALKKILRTDYALIILDVQMPGMDGYEVAEAVSSLNNTRGTPIIFLSAVNIDKRFIIKGYISGGVDYVTKPFDPDLLLLKVRSFYRLTEQNRELRRIGEELRNEVERRKKAQEEIEQMNLQLEEKVEQRTKELLDLNYDLENRNTELAQYASLASHDLQEPLRKIITFSKIINERYLTDIPDAQFGMKKVISSTERMRDMINDLLNYSKLSAQFLFTKVDLEEILQNTLSDLEITIQEKDAEIVTEKLPVIEAVPGQMRQMFQNLISNALKFSKKDVRPVITIRCETTCEKIIENSTCSEGEFIRITISDNGIGFDEAYFEKIFTLFQRLHGRNEYEGTGIGLAIVKKIIERHNGIIGVKSCEGKGANFIIVLPVKQAVNLP